ncbi:MAG: calcium/sodium antiporter [Planctomycetota bacterium]
MSLANISWLVLGLIVLTIGAEALVRGASRLAAAARISPLVIGLTVVSLGTSAPELAVSIRSALNGQADIALGNVVGSNILNVLLILGLAATITPLVVSVQLVRLDAPLMVAISCSLLWFAWDGRISRTEGACLALGLVAYVLFTVHVGRREAKRKEAADFEREYGEASTAPRKPLLDLLLVGSGLAALVLGADWFVGAAVAIATSFGLSELIIGLTIVAFGTSLPEVATSVVASLKGERDIAVGNVVGSNVFNILGVLGITAFTSASGVAVPQAALSFDLPVMIAVAFACLPIFFTGHEIARWEGIVFLGYYVAYTTYLVLAATKHDGLESFSHVMAWYVLPLTGLTLAVTTFRAVRAGRLT